MAPSNQLSAVSDAGKPSLAESFRYDKSGNRVSRQLGNSVSTSTFNALNQIASETPGGKIRVAGTTDEPSNVTVQGSPATMLSATNFVGVASVSTGTNTIPVVATDGSGNSRTNSYQVVVPTAAAKSFSFDPNGNLLSDGSRTYAWDGLNRLVKITQGADVFEFAYDGFNRRISEKKNGTLIKRFVWDNHQLVQERDATNQVTRQLLPQGEISGGVPLIYARDHLGSVRDVLNASGATVASYSFDTWGRRTVLGDADATNVGFAGHHELREAGLVLAPFRSFDPEIGRWLSRDPIGEGGGINLYGYVANNPINLIDPNGLWQVTISAGYYYAGKLTFGYNEGKANVGVGVGLGLGAKLDFNPNDKDPNKPSNADPCQSNYGSIRLGISAGVGSGPLGNVSGELSMSSKADDFNNVHGALSGTLTAAEPVFGNRVGGTLSANLYGSGNTGEYTGNIGISTTSSIAVGGMIFGGVSAGISW